LDDAWQDCFGAEDIQNNISSNWENEYDISSS
jgi:hypothetical protein